MGPEAQRATPSEGRRYQNWSHSRQPPRLELIDQQVSNTGKTPKAWQQETEELARQTRAN